MNVAGWAVGAGVTVGLFILGAVFWGGFKLGNVEREQAALREGFDEFKSEMRKLIGNGNSVFARAEETERRFEEQADHIHGLRESRHKCENVLQVHEFRITALEEKGG